MLIVPVISLLNNLAVDYLDRPLSRTGCSFEEPVKMARLWRVQNAKVIHIIDRIKRPNIDQRFEALRRIQSSLDIPIQLETEFDSSSLDHALTDINVARVVVRITDTDVGLLQELIQQYGASRVCSLITYSQDSDDNGRRESLMRVVEQTVATGCRRIVLRDPVASNQLHGHSRSLLAFVAQAFPRIKFSASGGIGSYRELKLLETEAPRNADSVIIGRALYENTFPCQKFWCWHQKETVDLEQFSSASMRGE